MSGNDVFAAVLFPVRICTTPQTSSAKMPAHNHNSGPRTGRGPVVDGLPGEGIFVIRYGMVVTLVIVAVLSTLVTPLSTPMPM